MQTDIIGRRVWLFYNAIGAVAQCTNNWGVGSVFPTLENTYFLQKCCHQPDPMNIRSFQYYAADNEYG